jgi:hypothetical protein
VIYSSLFTFEKKKECQGVFDIGSFKSSAELELGLTSQKIEIQGYPSPNCDITEFSVEYSSGPLSTLGFNVLQYPSVTCSGPTGCKFIDLVVNNFLGTVVINVRPKRFNAFLY